jgi:hypothetical protein
MSDDILQNLAQKFIELKQMLMDEYDIDLRDYDPQDYEDNDDLIDVLESLFFTNQILERHE